MVFAPFMRQAEYADRGGEGLRQCLLQSRSAQLSPIRRCGREPRVSLLVGLWTDNAWS
jgi:hypothetical protein